jgi:hypothetical protein
MSKVLLVLFLIAASVAALLLLQASVPRRPTYTAGQLFEVLYAPGSSHEDKVRAVEELAKSDVGQELLGLPLQAVDDPSPDPRLASQRIAHAYLLAIILDHGMRNPNMRLLYGVTYQLKNDEQVRFSDKRGSEYVDGSYGPVREFAHRALRSALKVDFGYDEVQWRNYLYQPFWKEEAAVTTRPAE